MDPIVLVIGVFVGVSLAIVVRRHIVRRRALERLREDWGRVRVEHLDRSIAGEAWLEAPQGDSERSGVDDQTWSDLELDSVVAAVDRTSTGLGQQRLYQRLRSGDGWLDTPEMEALVSRFVGAPPLRERIGVQLRFAGRPIGRGFWIITRPSLIRMRWWYWSFPVLAFAMLFSLVAIPFAPRFILAAVALAVLNWVVRTATAWQLPGVLGPMRQLTPLMGTARRVAALLEDDPRSRTVRNDLAHLRSLRRVARWVSRDPAMAGELVTILWEYANNLFLLDANALLYCALRQKDLAPRLDRIASWLGDVDVALSVASLRAESRAWCVPELTTARRTTATGIWHPLVARPVPNDVELRMGEGMVISGANMSGKSTYLRTIAVAAILARALNTCPASRWCGPLFRVRSLIGRDDDLQAGKSYYQVEVDGVIALLRDSEDDVPTLFLLDEVLRGTNTTERLAAGEAVLRALLNGRDQATPHVVVVSTHDRELVSMLEGLYTPWHFRESVGPNGLTFNYKRWEGPATTRTAIALLEASGAPSTVVEAARGRVEELDAESNRWMPSRMGQSPE